MVVNAEVQMAMTDQAATVQQNAALLKLHPNDDISVNLILTASIDSQIVFML